MSTKIPLRWVGALFDHSGYGSASRSYIDAMLESNKFDLTLSAVSFEPEHTTHGDIQQKCMPLVNRKDVDYKMNIIHLTPENYPSQYVRGKINVGYTTWEADRLPPSWVDLCNQMDQIWVPSTWNRSVFLSSGIRKPVHVVPHTLSLHDNIKTETLDMNINKDAYVFYSIFQWIERKNPGALLKAYLTEFTKNDNVCLVIKTYRRNTSEKEKALIKEEIVRLKRGLNLSEYPPILFFGDLLSSGMMENLHQRCDCFVLPHRAEGFGIPLAESMIRGTPTISTNYSGNLDFMNESNSYLVDYQLTPVSNMIFGLYDGSMTWADPSIHHLKQLMRYVYNNREEAKKIGEVGRATIQSLLAPTKITNRIHTLVSKTIGV